MAVVPSYGREVGAPGPSRQAPQQGPLYDHASAVWSKVLGDAAGTLGALDQNIRAARISVDATDRAASFSLGVQGVLSRSSQLKVNENGVERLADPDEQEQFFRDQTEALIARYSDMPKADLQTRASLRNSMTNEIVSGLGKLRTLQLKQEMQTIADKAQATREKALLSGNKALYGDSLDDLVETGVISQGRKETELAEFDTSSQLYQIRSQLDSVLTSDAPAAQRLAQLGVQDQALDTFLDAKNLTEEQRKLALSLKGDVTALTAQQNKAQLLQTRENDRQVTARVLETLDGRAENPIKPSDITDAMAAGLISEEAGKSLWDRLKNPRQDTDLRAMSEVRSAILDYQAGARTLDETLSVVYASQNRLSDTDAQSMITRIYGTAETEGAYWQREAEQNIEDSMYPRNYFGAQDRKEPYVTAVSQVKLQLDKAIEESRKAGKPLTGRDIVIKARDLAAIEKTKLEAEGTKSIDEYGAGLKTRKTLNVSTAMEYLRRAKGNREEAKRLAEMDGYEAPE